jgi:hypothetical protein
MSSIATLIDEYLSGPQLLQQAVAGMSAEQLRARPVPGKWSTLDVVCHLSDFETVYADRMKRIAAEECPEILGADQDGYARALAYDKRDVEDELILIEQTRRQMARILRALPPAAFARTATHREGSARETRTLEKYLRLIVGHIPHHTKFIQEKRQALGLPPSQ